MAKSKSNTPKQLSKAQYDREYAKLAEEMRALLRNYPPAALDALERFSRALGEYVSFERGRQPGAA